MSGLRRWALLASLVGSAACGYMPLSASPASTSSVPWLPLPPAHRYVQAPLATPLPPLPIPQGTPECRAAQLEGESIGEAGAMGNVDMPLLFRNKGADDCWLEGYPGISVLNESGDVLASSAGTTGQGTYFADGPVTQILLLAGTPQLEPISGPMGRFRGPRGQAWMNMSWYDCASPRASRAVVELSPGDRFSIPFTLQGDANPACFPGSTARPVIFRGPLSPGGMTWPPAPVYVSDAITILATGSVRGGSTLDFLVRIDNQDTQPFDMLPCADYRVGLQPKRTLDERQLNCSPVGTIAPSGSATFDMRLDVPSTMPKGTYQMFWFLDDGRLGSGSATATIAIT